MRLWLAATIGGEAQMTANRKPRIAVVGSNMVDLITYVNRMPARGETIEAPSFEMGHGGKGANQAIAAAKLGASVVMVTKVGDDMFADSTIKNFARFGVDTTHVERVSGRSSGVAPIMVEPSGENSILIVKGANSGLSPVDVERAAEDLKVCDLILLQLEVPLETVYAAIAFGARHGVKTLLNPAPATPELDLEKIRDVSFLVPNETELAILTGMPVESESEIASAARSLIANGIGTVIATMGSRGALLTTPTQVKHIAPIRVGPVDTTGAGDAFVGSFARYFAAGLGVEAALEKAVRYAADSVTRRGTQKAYSMEPEFDAFCESMTAAPA
jgi:ribokinase